MINPHFFLNNTDFPGFRGVALNHGIKEEANIGHHIYVLIISWDSQINLPATMLVFVKQR
jgi:hypothetical protein